MHSTLDPPFVGGDTVIFTCDDGFVLEGRREIKCDPLTQEWSDLTPVCRGMHLFSRKYFAVGCVLYNDVLLRCYYCVKCPLLFLSVRVAFFSLILTLGTLHIYFLTVKCLTFLFFALDILD